MALGDDYTVSTVSHRSVWDATLRTTFQSRVTNVFRYIHVCTYVLWFRPLPLS